MDRISQLKTYLETAPDDSFLNHAMALELVKQGKDTEARKIFERILEKDENYIGSYYHLCQLLQRLDQKEEAVKCYEKGMLKAKEAGDNHAYNELLSAYEDLVY
jgi:Tfp pilus assembly protein PilF